MIFFIGYFKLIFFLASFSRCSLGCHWFRVSCCIWRFSHNHLFHIIQSHSSDHVLAENSGGSVYNHGHCQ